MALAMSRPWKHPTTGVYWLRKRVPVDLHVRVGKREEKRSLKTRDPAEAKRRHLQALSDLEVQWANLRAGPRTLTEREAHDLATVVHDHWLKIHRDNPSEQNVWPTSLGERVFKPRPPIGTGRSVTEIVRAGIDDGSFKIMDLEKWCFVQADELIHARGLLIDETGRARLAKAIAAAVQRASVTLDRYARGEDEPETIRIAAGPDRANRPICRSPGRGNHSNSTSWWLVGRWKSDLRRKPFTSGSVCSASLRRSCAMTTRDVSASKT
jgi:hypothetical protein